MRDGKARPVGREHNVEITNKMGQRALTYVAAVASQGYELTFAEFEAYVSMPVPDGRVWSPGQGPGGGGGAAAGDGPAEPILNWLTRLGWLERGEVTVRISQLGRAVLRAVEHQQREVQLPTEVTLGPDEPFDYGRVLGRIAEQRDALLVDPFLQTDQLMDIVHRTAVTRVLVGADRQYEAERRNLAEALSRTLGLDRPFYVGVSSELRDRYVIPPSGPVGFLATSVSRGGERLAVIGTIEPPIADAVRRTYEDVWSRATPLVAESLVTLNGDLGGPRASLIAPPPLSGDAAQLGSGSLSGDLGMGGMARNGDMPRGVDVPPRAKHQEDRDPQLRAETWPPPKMTRGGDPGHREDGQSTAWTLDEPHGN
jgi:hypothetical protein